MKRCCKQILRGTNWFLVAILSIALALMACQPIEPITSEPREFIDDLGRTVIIDGIPERIISLAPSNTEILFALGLGDKVVGVTDWCDYPPEALEKEKVGAYDTPNIERIAALNPDLILAAHGLPLDIIDALENLELTVFGIKTTDLDDLLNDIRTVGNITGEEAAANVLTSEMESRIAAVTDQTEGLEQRPKVFYIVWHDPLFTVGSETFIHELIEKAGGVNIFGDLSGYPVVSIEEVLPRDPEVIITSVWSFEWALNATELASTNASQEGGIFTCDDDLVQRPAPRIVDGLEWFAYFIHPAIFDEPEGS
ncbi:MAG: ABC transporter substrate-binding protein [Dehalococcoidia bacterium]